jgi:predicted nicotinamide N-methyase
MGPDAALGRCATTWAPVPFVPEVTLLTADQPWELWDASGRDAPPFWAFPWAGGQALARYVLDNPAVVRGRHVLDVASGSGLVAIAAAKAGAASVTAGDIDPDAVAAIHRNAAANKVAATVREIDMARDDAGAAEVVLAADVFYQRELAAVALAFLRRAAGAGADALCGDPGRAFVPRDWLEPVARYEVPVLTAIEDAPVKAVTVYRIPY